MRIAFIFPSDFNITTVFTRALGGSESAVSYLAIELAKLGHDITLITSNKANCIEHGVRCLSLTLHENGNIDFPQIIQTEQFDCFVMKNAIPMLGGILKNALSNNPKTIFWTGHSYDQPAIANLKEPSIINGLDSVYCVSEWQKQSFINNFNIPEHKFKILRNAIAPSFQNMYKNYEEFIATKLKTPQLIYSSTPFRGLEHLLKIYPSIYQACNSKSTLEVYSSMQVYGLSPEQDEFKHLYTLAKDMGGVNYHGSVPQSQLAEAFRLANIFSYPNVFAETSCISVMEAIAAGLHVVTTNLGALPETCAGMADIVEPLKILAEGHDSFTNVLIDNCKKIVDDPNNYYKKQYENVLKMNQECTWAVRAREFVENISL